MQHGTMSSLLATSLYLTLLCFTFTLKIPPVTFSLTADDYESVGRLVSASIEE